LSDVAQDGTIELTNVFTLSEARGKGLGRQVVEEAIEVAKEKGAKRIIIDNYSYLEDFYKKFNFKKIDEFEFDPKFSEGFDPRILGRESDHNIVLMELNL